MRFSVDDSLLVELLNGLDDKKKYVANLKELFKFKMLPGISPSELNRIDRLSKQKVLW